MGLYNRVKVVTATTGTGPVTLGAAVDDTFQSFADAEVADGKTVPLLIEEAGEVELSRGVYSSSGETVSRTYVWSSTGSLLDLSGSATVTITVLAEDIAGFQIDTFTASGTWTKPAWAQTVEVICIGAGGGGGSGRKGVAGTSRGGGGGGAGGGFSRQNLSASLVPETVSMVVGAGGVGAAGQTTNSTNGNLGGDGGASSFGNLVAAGGGGGGQRGQTSNSATGATAGYGTEAFGATGLASSITNGGAGNQANYPGACSGGNGGPITSANAAVLGGQGRNTANDTEPPWINADTVSPTASTSVVAGNGSSATNLPNSRPFGGESGDGGAASLTGNGGNGGNGGRWGGGGGGGGAAVNDIGNSGAGGNGGDGLVVVISRS